MSIKDVQGFIEHLEQQGRTEKLSTSFDNKKASVQRWFPFFAGFSFSIVEEALKFFGMADGENLVFDPFMGSGTTGVVCQRLGVNVVGNEINPFLHRICKAKMNSHIEVNISDFKSKATKILEDVSNRWQKTDIENEHPILKRCYPEDNLKKLLSLRFAVSDEKYRVSDYEKYLFVILSRCLIPSAQVGINIPYISWSSRKQPKEVFKLFTDYLSMICCDIQEIQTASYGDSIAEVFRHDSRDANKYFPPKSVRMVFTSPPYLNNFDYGEALKVFLYFWKIANNWNEISEKIRKPSVTSATTHYKIADFGEMSYEEILGEEFINALPHVSADLLQKAELIKKEINRRKGSKKTFDILALLYFKDMFQVLKEIERVVHEGALSFFVVGDSAPYGVHILTDALLGEMAIELGFSDYTLHPLRKRGLKWTTLTYRHKVVLRESLLVLRR